MEYKGYTPDLIKKDKRKNSFLLIIVAYFLFLGVIVLFAGIRGAFGGNSVAVYNVSEIPYTSIDYDGGYYFDKMVVIDTYGSMKAEKSGKVLNNYYVVSFIDGDGENVYTSLKTEPGSEIDEKCQAYLEDESSEVGDLVLSGYFEVAGNDAKVALNFSMACMYLKREKPGGELNLSLEYSGAETVEEYKSKTSTSYVANIIMGLVLVVPLVFALLFLIRRRKELNRYLAEYNREPSDRQE